MLIKAAPLVDAADNPTKTADKRLREFMPRLDWERLRYQERREITIPGVNLASVKREWGPHNAGKPRIEEATFRVSVGITWPLYERERNEAVAKFLKVMDSKGYDLKPWPGRKQPIIVSPGVYPAVDLYTGLPLIGEREFIIRAHFSMRRPKLITLEFESELFQPTTINA